MIIISLITLIVFSFVLLFCADQVVVSIKRLSASSNEKIFLISAFLLAFTTSIPEFFVGVTSALEGTPNLSLGNVLGANIANIAFVTGVAAVIAGKIVIRGPYLRRDLATVFVASLFPFILILDGSLNQIDGLILIACYVAYTTSIFKVQFVQIAEEVATQRSFTGRFLHRVIDLNGRKKREIARFFFGVAGLLFASDMIVKSANSVAESLGLPVFLVGLIMLSLGTTLPELAFSVRSLREHEPTMFFGNVFGSIIANSTLVIGVVAILRPFRLVAVGNYTFAAIAFIVFFAIFWLFTKSKHRLDRWEAATLTAIYLVFVIIELVVSS